MNLSRKYVNKLEIAANYLQSGKPVTFLMGSNDLHGVLASEA
jgi:hypothetical protein